MVGRSLRVPGLAIGYQHYNSSPIVILSHHEALEHDDECLNWATWISKLADSEFNKLSTVQSKRMKERRKPLLNFDAALENKKKRLKETPTLQRMTKRQLPVLQRLQITLCPPQR
jgi:hypothetical protein